MFNLFLTPVYDTATAKKFCGSMNKEFGIDQEYSDRADQMLGHMDTLVKSFEEPGTDYAAAEEAIRTFLMQGGFSLSGRKCRTPSSFPPVGSRRSTTRRSKRESFHLCVKTARPLRRGGLAVFIN